MSIYYQRFLKILEKWPVDKTKPGRDFGEHLRNQAKTFVNPTSITSQNSENFGRQLDALERLTNNVHGNKHKRSLTSTATGLTAEQCSQALSSEFLYYLNNDNRFFSKNKKE